jgi:hypothetical protein
MKNDLYKAYAEVDEILSFMEDVYIDKIPKKLRELFKNERLEDYKPNINPKIPLDEQKLQKKTFSILAMLNLNYWCEDEKEKQDLIAIYAENDRKKEEKLREKYNPDNLFKKKETEQKIEEPQKNIAENTVLVEYKEEKFFKKLIKKIMNFLKEDKEAFLWKKKKQNK